MCLQQRLPYQRCYRQDVYKRQAPKKEREYAAERLDGVITKIKNAMQHALAKIQRTLMQPEVKQAGKEQVKKKAKEDVYKRQVLVIGGSGSGKTRFWLKPNLMQMHTSGDGAAFESLREQVRRTADPMCVGDTEAVYTCLLYTSSTTRWRARRSTSTWRWFRCAT